MAKVDELRRFSAVMQKKRGGEVIKTTFMTRDDKAVDLAIQHCCRVGKAKTVEQFHGFQLFEHIKGAAGVETLVCRVDSGAAEEPPTPATPPARKQEEAPACCVPTPESERPFPLYELEAA